MALRFVFLEKFTNDFFNEINLDSEKMQLALTRSLLEQSQ